MIIIHDGEYNIICKNCGSIHTKGYKELYIGDGSKEEDFKYWLECEMCKNNNKKSGMVLKGLCEWDWASMNSKTKIKIEEKKTGIVEYIEINEQN